MFQYSSIIIFIFIILIPILIVNIIVNNDKGEHFNDSFDVVFDKNITSNRKAIIKNAISGVFGQTDTRPGLCNTGYKLEHNPFVSLYGKSCRGGKYFTDRTGTKCACVIDDNKIINVDKVNVKNKFQLGDTFITEYDLKRAILNKGGFKKPIKSKLILDNGSNEYNNIENSDIDNFKNLWPEGSIISFSGNIRDIPKGWLLCDGNNGTPDLTETFIKGLIDSPVVPEPTQTISSNNSSNNPRPFSLGINYLTVNEADIPKQPTQPPPPPAPAPGTTNKCTEQDKFIGTWWAEHYMIQNQSGWAPFYIDYKLVIEKGTEECTINITETNSEWYKHKSNAPNRVFLTEFDPPVTSIMSTTHDAWTYSVYDDMDSNGFWNAYPIDADKKPISDRPTFKLEYDGKYLQRPGPGYCHYMCVPAHTVKFVKGDSNGPYNENENFTDKKIEHFTPPDPIDKRPPFYSLFYIIRADKGENIIPTSLPIATSNELTDEEREIKLRDQVRMIGEEPIV